MGSQQRLPWPSVCGSLELTARARRSSSSAWILPSRGSVCPFSHPCFRWSTLLTRHDRYSFLFSLPSPAPPFVPTTGQRNLLLIFLLANISLRIPWVHQSDAIESDHRLLAVAEGFVGKKARRAIAAQIGDDHPVALLRQQRGNVDIAVNIVGPAVQKHDRRTIGGASFSVADIQYARIDLFQRTEGRVRPGPPHTFHLSSKTIRCMKTVQRSEQVLFILTSCSSDFFDGLE